jgi:nicotinate-nucleotide pyrophosphorylase (carboxylating)
VRLENVRQIAETGVQRISVGALTHSAPAADVALEIAEGPAPRPDGGAGA